MLLVPRNQRLWPSIDGNEFEVHQGHEFFRKDHPHYFTRSPMHHSTGQPSRTMPYRAQSSQSHDITHDATQNTVLREEVSSLLQPVIELPSSGTLLGGPFLLAAPSPKAFMRSAQSQGKQAC
jgi:hypothetical protein